MRQGRLRAQKYRQAFGGGIRHRTRCYQHRLEGCARGRIMSNFFSMEREVGMRFFRLTPINLDDPNWSCSTHKGPCLVPAIDEKAARDAATAEFKIAEIGRASCRERVSQYV